MAKKEYEEVTAEKPFDFETHQFNTFEDYDVYNAHCHRAFREAKKTIPKCDPPFPVKVPPESMHKKIKVKFQRFDQPQNLSKVRFRNKAIDWEGQLKPGRIYELPLPVINYLNKLATPIFAEVKVEDGGETITETRQVGETSRFSCHPQEMMA